MEAVNKAIVGRNLAAPTMRLRHSPRRGREEVKAFMVGLRQAFPDFALAEETSLADRAPASVTGDS